MKRKDGIKDPCFWLKKVIAVVFITMAIIFGYEQGILLISEVQAASKNTAVKEPAKEPVIHFTDKSGKYLIKVKNQWYLKEESGNILTGVQYVRVAKSSDFQTGYYMFNSKGRLVPKIAVYYFKQQTIGHVTFKGYHCTNSKGRFVSNSFGLASLKKLTCNGRTFNGIFYLGDHGRLTASAQVRKISATRVSGVSIASGYYYFNSAGQLATVPSFRTVNQKLDGKTFHGTYYFGGKNGALVQKAGWVTLKNKRYYISSTGRQAQNCWKSGYYLLSDGTIAKNQRVPDGSYVDCDGHKCAKAEMKLSAMKRQLTAMTNSYPGTWSVYVKNLKTGDVVNLNDKAMYPASVIKPFVMASTFEQIKNKKLSYSSGVKNLLKEMITVSDNEAYNELVRLNSPSHSFASGASVVNGYLKKNGYRNTECHSTLHPSSSSYTSDGGTNKSSAKDCGILLEKIYRGTCVSSRYSKDMLNLLLGQTRRWKIPSGLPAGTKVANKTGETSTAQHDMAIVYGPKTTYVLCVFSTGAGEYYGINGIRNISGYVYNYLNK